MQSLNPLLMLISFPLPLPSPPPAASRVPCRELRLCGHPEDVCMAGGVVIIPSCVSDMGVIFMNHLTKTTFLVLRKRSCHLHPPKPQATASILATNRDCEWAGKGGEMGNTVLDRASTEFISQVKCQDPKPPLTNKTGSEIQK